MDMNCKYFHIYVTDAGVVPRLGHDRFFQILPNSKFILHHTVRLKERH
jgi:hypothetical protein